jgi:hypothetical protein
VSARELCELLCDAVSMAEHLYMCSLSGFLILSLRSGRGRSLSYLTGYHAPTRRTLHSRIPHDGTRPVLPHYLPTSPTKTPTPVLFILSIVKGGGQGKTRKKDVAITFPPRTIGPVEPPYHTRGASLHRAAPFLSSSCYVIAS